MKIGLTLASLNALGYFPDDKDMLNNWERGLAIRSAVIFSSFIGRLSGPVDLFASREFNICNTSFSVVSMLSRAGTGAVLMLFCGGTCVFGTCTVDCEAK